MPQRPKVLLIGGPTASGKSALALEIAAHKPSVIINADSMQLYRGLPLLTAFPSNEDMAKAPHVLYGIFEPDIQKSVNDWLDLVIVEINRAHSQGLLPIVVGGTGFYLMALERGLSEMPPKDSAIDLQLNKLIETQGLNALYGELKTIDPKSANRISENDSQRILRALGVWHQTGKTLSQWQTDHPPQPPAFDFSTLLLFPEREHLRAKANERFDQMMNLGALEELKNYLHMRESFKKGPFPLDHALGVEPLRAYLEGNLDLDAAINRSKIETHQYIKRQITWFKNQCNPTLTLSVPHLRPEDLVTLGI